jgi:hypothetical protein
VLVLAAVVVIGVVVVAGLLAESGRTSRVAAVKAPTNAAPPPPVVSPTIISVPPAAQPTLTIPSTGTYVVGGSCYIISNGQGQNGGSFLCMVIDPNMPPPNDVASGAVNAAFSGQELGLAPYGAVLLQAGDQLSVDFNVTSGSGSMQFGTIWAIPVTPTH